MHGKDYSRQRAQRLVQSVECWFDDPQRPDRQVGWITLPSLEYVRPVVRIAVRYRQPNGRSTIGILLSTLSASDVLQLTEQPLSLLPDSQSVLLAYVADK